MNSSDEFYIGWQSQAPRGIGVCIRKTVLLLCILTFFMGGLIAYVQRSIGTAVFEWGTQKMFTGGLSTSPYPYLSVKQPGIAAGHSDYLLVAPFKHGLRLDPAVTPDGSVVTLKGTLIFRGNQTMIEVLPETIKPAAQSDALSVNGAERSSTTRNVTLVGEIVDSKCYFGVMNPGRLTPHRGCAVRCISGGIPPLLLVQQKDGRAATYLLVSANGSPVNQQVLDMVAEPLQITGDLVEQGSLKILRADPSTYRRVKN
jgi:hypothetical protein